MPDNNSSVLEFHPLFKKDLPAAFLVEEAYWDGRPGFPREKKWGEKNFQDAVLEHNQLGLLGEQDGKPVAYLVYEHCSTGEMTSVVRVAYNPGRVDLTLLFSSLSVYFDGKDLQVAVQSEDLEAVRALKSLGWELARQRKGENPYLFTSPARDLPFTPSSDG
jgi:hypothetical protein